MVTAGKNIERLIAIATNRLHDDTQDSTIVILYDDGSTAILGEFKRIAGFPADISVTVQGETHTVRAA